MADTTTNHDEIRAWAEKYGGRPACVEATGSEGDTGMIRLMFPDSPQSEHEGLREISWEAFFEQFEESGLALLYERHSQFNKLVARS